jgi:hypothetical protein
VIKASSSLNKKAGFLNITHKIQRRISMGIKNLLKNIGRKDESQVKRICNENYKKIKKKRVKGKNGSLTI